MYLTTQLHTSVHNLVLERLEHLVPTREMFAHHLEQLVEFCIICSELGLDVSHVHPFMERIILMHGKLYMPDMYRGGNGINISCQVSVGVRKGLYSGFWVCGRYYGHSLR